MHFSQFANYLQEIESVSSRLAITEKLAGLFTKLSPEEIAVVPYLLQGRVAPAYTGVEFGMAEKSVVKAAAYALNLDHADFVKEVRKHGDMGGAIEQARATYTSFEQEDMPVCDVFQELSRIASSAGAGSQETKSRILAGLFTRLDPLSCKYISRIPLGQMRLGASDITILDAYSWMIAGDKSLRGKIEKAYQVRPDLGYVGQTLKRSGVSTIEGVHPQVHTPILMMKAERLSTGKEIMAKLEDCVIEPKYDGLRLQVHLQREKKKDKSEKNTQDIAKIQRQKIQDKSEKKKADKTHVEIFTRGMERATHMYPDIVDAVTNELDCESCILEGEALGYDFEKQSFLSFQETIQRKRKHNVAETADAIPLKLLVFDLLYLNGESLLTRSLIERRRALERIVVHKKNAQSVLEITPVTKPQSAEDIEGLFDTYISQGLEGIMAKKSDSVYKPGAREYSWVKLKKSYSDKVQDTLDCVVMGYDAGKGKRSAFGIGAVLVGVYDPHENQYLTLAKIGTGMTDEEWRELKTQSNKHKAQNKPGNYVVAKEVAPDFWVSPHVVLEIRCDELTVSKLHSSGWSMRFPRLERFRSDKRATDATTLKEILKMGEKG